MTYPRVKVLLSEAEGTVLIVRNEPEDKWFVWSPDGDFYGSEHDPENDGMTDEQVAAWPEALWPAQITLTKDTPPQGSAPISRDMPR